MGGSPKAPPKPPDPAVAAEKARRESVAMGLADARRTARYGTTSTIHATPQPGVAALPRPTEAIAQYSLENTAVDRANKQIAELKAQRPALIVGRSPGAVAGLDKKIKALRESISPASKSTYESLQKDNAIASYINQTRGRVGVKASTGVAK